MDFFAKPVDVLKPEDLEALAKSGIDENQTLEFKSALPGHERGTDPWVNERKINDGAKFEVLKRIVSFANADGGWFIVGLAEPSDSLTYVDRLNPLPYPGDLANRLQQLAYERIDPPLSVLSIGAVVTDDKAVKGVVVVRVPRSRRAPHAVKGKGAALHCFVRRGKHTRELSMRDIQTLTINLSRGDEQLRHMLESRRHEFRRLRTPQGGLSVAVGCRITAAPVTSDILIDRVYQHESLFEFPKRVAAHLFQTPWSFPGIAPENMSTSPIHPQLRGAWRQRTSDHTARRITVLESGLVEAGYKCTEKGAICIWVGELIYDLVNVLRTVENVRVAGMIPGSEYALDVELRVAMDGPSNKDDSTAINIGLLKDEERPSCQFQPGPLRLPLFSVGGCETFQSVVDRVLSDIYNACGKGEPEPLVVDEFSKYANDH